jgi:hypothetical protein
MSEGSKRKHKGVPFLFFSFPLSVSIYTHSFSLDFGVAVPPLSSLELHPAYFIYTSPYPIQIDIWHLCIIYVS